MTVAVFAVPYLVPPVLNQWPGLKHLLRDGDTVWDLSAPQTAGVFLTDQGLRGVHLPPINDYVRTAAGVDGQTLRGFQVKARPVFWPLCVYSGEGTHAWLERDKALWASLAPNKTVQWEVVQPTGESRSLAVRVDPRGDDAFNIDPSGRGWHVYGVNLVADDPYWRGRTVFARSGGTETGAFIPETGAPEFFISGGVPLESLTINNPGDVPAWPVWEARGPHTDLVVSLGGRVVEFPDVLEGQTLVLDTSPWVRTALLDGEDVTHLLGVAEFAPVEPGEAQKISASSLGAGTFTVSVSPRFYRAW